MISTQHFYDSYQSGNREQTLNRVYRGLKKVLKERLHAIIYINGCSYYVKPLDDKRMGFGSGNLEIVFDDTDTEESEKDKLHTYLDKNYLGETGYYGGRDLGMIARTKIDMYCSW